MSDEKIISLETMEYTPLLEWLNGEWVAETKSYWRDKFPEKLELLKPYIKEMPKAPNHYVGQGVEFIYERDNQIYKYYGTVDRIFLFNRKFDHSKLEESIQKWLFPEDYTIIYLIKQPNGGHSVGARQYQVTERNKPFYYYTEEGALSRRNELLKAVKADGKA